MPFISICLRQGTKPCHERYVRTLGGVRRILRLRERLPKTSRDKRADHLTTPASAVAGRTDGIESASCCGQRWIAGQRPLPCCLTCRIDVKDNVAATLAVE